MCMKMPCKYLFILQSIHMENSRMKFRETLWLFYGTLKSDDDCYLVVCLCVCVFFVFVALAGWLAGCLSSRCKLFFGFFSFILDGGSFTTFSRFLHLKKVKIKIKNQNLIYAMSFSVSFLVYSVMVMLHLLFAIFRVFCLRNLIKMMIIQSERAIAICILFCFV